MKKNIESNISFFALLFIFFAFPIQAHAVPLEVIESPQSTEAFPNFPHNVVHTASQQSGQEGDILAWFDLDKNQSSTYDPDTGILNAYFNIFNESDLAVKIGSVSAIGELPGAKFNKDSNDVAGTLFWTFKMTDLSSPLNQYLNNEVGGNIQGFYDVELTYLDKFYKKTSDGQTVNSWDGSFLVLWGANGFDSRIQAYNPNFTNLATNMVLSFDVVPEPSSLLLLTSGIFGGFWVRKRRSV